MEDNVFNAWAAATLGGLINSMPSRERLIYHSTNDDTFGLLTNRTNELSAPLRRARFLPEYSSCLYSIRLVALTCSMHALPSRMHLHMSSCPTCPSAR